MTSPANTTKVYLDDGSGTFPTDITADVRMRDGISISGYGRTDEFNQPSAATLTLALDNETGTYTSGAGFGVDGFGVGAFGGPPASPGVQRVRVTETRGATTVNTFTGRVESLGLGWPGGGDEFSVVTLTAVDPLADLGRRPMRSMLEEEVLLRGPVAYYTLGEPDGATAAGDTSGNQAPLLTMVGPGAAVTFGSGTGPVDGLSAAIFGGGQWLQGGSGASVTSTSTSGALFAAFATTTTPTSNAYVGWHVGWMLYVDTSGRINGDGPGFTGLVGPVVTDGSTHTALITGDGTTATLYLDGNVAATSSMLNSGTDSVDYTTIGGTPSASATSSLNSFTGTVSHVAAWNVGLNSTSATAITSVTVTTSETTDARLARLASYAGLTATAASPSGQMMGPQATSGSSLFDAMQQVATTEGGVLFCNGSGDLVMQGRYYRSLKITPDLTLGDEEAAPDTTITWDRQQFINQVTVSRTGGAQQVVQNGTPSVVFPASLEVNTTTDADALAAGQWLLGKHSTMDPRIGSITFDLMTSGSAEPLLGLEIGDRISLSALPSQTWPGATDYTIEGWSRTISDGDYTVTANLLPWQQLSEVAIYDQPTSVYNDAVYGY